MPNSLGHSSSIRLAIAPGVPIRPLSDLLALQREEEPEVTIAVFEASGDALIAGLREGRYDIGLTLADVMDASLRSQPLWREALAIAMPSRYPLLRHARLTLDDVRHYYPIFRWQAEPCPLLHQRMAADETERLFKVQYVPSFDMLALWVAAGYGIGITAQSRLTHARAWEIAMRPLLSDAHAPYEVVTHLLSRQEAATNAAHARLHRRARQLAIRSYVVENPP